MTSRTKDRVKVTRFKLSDYKSVESIKLIFGEKLIKSAPHIRTTDSTATFPGWIIREMVKNFDGYLLVCVDGVYKFAVPAWRGYRMFEKWGDYPSVTVHFFEGYWNIQ